MNEIASLGYFGYTHPDVAPWKAFATDVLGATVTEGDNGTLRLRVDDHAWRIELAPGEPALTFVGWEIRTITELDAVRRRLENAGYSVTTDDEIRAARNVEALIFCDDPNGVRTEFFVGMRIPAERFVSPKGYRFVTGDLGLGHLVLGTPDPRAELDFYVDVLGFRHSDIVRFNGGEAHFLHTNPRHHSIAFGMAPAPEVRLNHLMLELEDLGMVGTCLDSALSHGSGLVSQLGQHANDLVTSFYLHSPAPFAIEVGTGGRLVDDSTWSVMSYDARSIWGHQRA